MGDNLEYKKVLDEEEECMICFENFKKYQTKVKCCFCKNVCHYKCYKKFIKININYSSKCIHCSTKSIFFDKPWWMCLHV
jgi:hypothetical protein